MGLRDKGLRGRWREARLTQGCDVVITNGKRPEALYDIIEGQGVGTLFVGKH